MSSVLGNGMELKLLPPLGEATCRVYFCRHGRTTLNAQNIVQGGGMDAPLDDVGIKQAAQLGKAFNHIEVDTVLTSAMARAIDTGKEIKTKNNRLIDARLNEMHYGELEGHPIFVGETKRKIAVAYSHWLKDDADYCLPGPLGESFTMVVDRSKAAVHDCIEKFNPNHLVVVCHSRLIRVLLAHLNNSGPSGMDKVQSDNCSIAVFDFCKSALKSKMVATNLVSHL